MTDSDNLNSDFLKNMISELATSSNTILEAYDKRNKEVNYFLKRLDNLIALVNLSEEDIPKELLEAWTDETLGELLKMEGIDPGKFKK